MAKVRLGINNLSVPELVARARQIGTALTGNTHFTNSQAIITQITAAADDLETANANAQAARQASLTATSILHEKTDALAQALRQTAAYIESVAGDDESKILSAGISIKNPPTTSASGLLLAPT